MHSKKPCLLIVEDNLANQKVALALAERYGYSAVLVNTGHEALEAVANAEGSFAAILMDLKMPEMNGIECTLVIRQFEEKSKQRTPIIGVTAYASLNQ